MQQSEDAFLEALADRPDDRALRLVFCDWLLERGDPRGEAMALFEKGPLSGVERRRLEKLQQLHGGKWLGPLSGAVDFKACRFAGGLLQVVRFPANLPASAYASLAGDPRLATVESISIEPGRVASEVGTFLAHPVFARVTELAGDVATLLKARGYAFAPQTLGIGLWDPRDDLARLAALAALQGATALRLSTVEFIIPVFVSELVDAVLASGALVGRKKIELLARHATLEGAVHWLRAGAERLRGAVRGTIERWGVDYAEAQLGLEGDALERLMIDAMAPGGKYEVDTRLASVGSVIVMLDGIGIKRVEVRHVPGGRLSKDELNTLRLAVRRLSTMEEFIVGGMPQSP